MPESKFFQRLREVTGILFGVYRSGLGGIGFGNFGVGTRAVEELRELPVGGGKAEHQIDATHHHANDALAVFDVFLPNNIGREAWGLVAEDARRDFGERDVENAGEVHGLAPRLAPMCSEAFMPGRNLL